MSKNVIEIQVGKQDNGTYMVDIYRGANDGDHPVFTDAMEALAFILGEMNQAFKAEVTATEPVAYKLSVTTWNSAIGAKISTIKLLREMTGEGLLEAKQMSERMEVSPVELSSSWVTQYHMEQLRSFGVTVEPVYL